MSYSGAGVDELVSELEAEEGVTEVQEAKVWQVHYGLAMASFRIRVRTREGGERVREGISRMVRKWLGGGEGQGVRWEVSCMVAVDGG